MEKYQDQLSIFSSQILEVNENGFYRMKSLKNIFIGLKLTISLNCWDKEIVKAGTLRCMSNTGLGKPHDKHWGVLQKILRKGCPIPSLLFIPPPELLPQLLSTSGHG